MREQRWGSVFTSIQYQYIYKYINQYIKQLLPKTP